MFSGHVWIINLKFAPIGHVIDHVWVINPRFTFVEHAETVVLQVAEDSRSLPAQILEVGGNILVHREPADLLHRLVPPQQVGFDRHRHLLRLAEHNFVTLEQCNKTL